MGKTMDLDDVRNGLTMGLNIASNSNGVDDFTKNLDAQVAEIQKEINYKKTKSKMKIRSSTQDLAPWWGRFHDIYQKNEMPPHGDPVRDFKLAEYWKQEPILAGAVYSMSAKMTALSWTMIGKKNLAKYFSNILTYASSMEGYDWGSFISSSAQDFYTVDRGVFWDTPRYGSSLNGRLAEIGHIDALQCALTGNVKNPVVYISSIVDQIIRYKPGEIVHFSSMPSARESHLGIGLCAVSRAWRAAKLLIGLHRYDEEKLNNLPPEGVAAVSGLSMDEFLDAVALWNAQREKNDSLTFPQVLWLLGNDPSAKVSLDIQSFSQIPESFNRKDVVEQYVNSLALVFGVDAREFWPISTSSMGTAAESEIQHMKAKGKGSGEFVSIVERRLNMELPDGVEFAFDTQDIEEDEKAAMIANAWVSALLPLTGAGQKQAQPMSKMPTNQGDDGQEKIPQQPQAPQSGGQEIIDKDTFLRLLIDRGVLPNWVLKDERSVMTDTGAMEKELYRYKDLVFSEDDDTAIYKWRNGKISQERPEPYTLSSRSRTLPDERNDIPYAKLLDHMKELAEGVLTDTRNIRGKPIPAKEAERGASITKVALKAELERWRNHPILRDYVPTLEEDAQLKQILESLA